MKIIYSLSCVFKKIILYIKSTKVILKLEKINKNMSLTSFITMEKSSIKKREMKLDTRNNTRIPRIDKKN
jgi:hypothetical protein